MRLSCTEHVTTVLACLTAGLLLSACGPIHSITVGHGRHDDHHRETRSGPSGHGPPPHAPAHGHRHNHRKAYHHNQGSAELVFDSALGVYVVVDLPAHYFWDGVYLRLDDGRWHASTHLDGDWRPRPDQSLPPGLLKKHGRSKKHNRGGKTRGPAKGRW